MTVVTFSQPARLAMAAVAAALAPATTSCHSGSGEPRSHVVTDSSPGKEWKTVEYRGVRLDIPADWSRANADDCEFSFERWVGSDASACGVEEGVAFYLSATFDPAHGPGPRRDRMSGPAATVWSGYVRVGDLAVYAADPDRCVVEEVLGSARETD